LVQLSVTLSTISLFFYCYRPHPTLPSFPTHALPISVRINDLDPYRTPALRRSIGTAAGNEHFEESTVLQAVGTRLALHGSKRSARETFRRFDMEHLLDRRTSSLADDERDAVALLIALSVDEPLVLLLHEPALSAPRLTI